MTGFVPSTGPFWKHFGAILSSKIVLEAPWTLLSSQTSILTAKLRFFWRILEASYGVFSRYFVIFLDINFTIGWHLLLR